MAKGATRRHAAPVEWDPEQYARFRRERTLPFEDLLALVARRPSMRVVDLGCGTGDLTRRLHDELGAASTVGVDASARMLEKAAAEARPGLSFVRADATAWAPGGPVDLVFSNAALHWLPGHPALVARFASWLAPGGQLAIQIPANQDYPTHAVAKAVASEEPFRSLLGGFLSPEHRLAPEAYALLLHRAGFARQHVRLQVYAHLLPSREAVVEWVKGSTLNDYRERLQGPYWEAFLGRYREALFAHLPDERPFLFPFKRILLRGEKD